jgi:RNA polymerase sporulation-specific sigma factor
MGHCLDLAGQLRGAGEGVRDAELVLRARGGDELAFRRLVDQCEWAIRRYLRELWAPGLTADDLRQEALCGLHKAVRDYQPSRGVPFKNFAGLCIQRQVITAVKVARTLKNRNLNEAASLAKPIVGAADDEDGTLEDLIADRSAKEPAEVIDLRGRVRKLTRAIAGNQLSELERDATVGLVEGFTYQEVADRYGVSVKTIDNASQRASAKLVALGLGPEAA